MQEADKKRIDDFLKVVKEKGFTINEYGVGEFTVYLKSYWSKLYTRLLDAYQKESEEGVYLTTEFTKVHKEAQLDKWDQQFVEYNVNGDTDDTNDILGALNKQATNPSLLQSEAYGIAYKRDEYDEYERIKKIAARQELARATLIGHMYDQGHGLTTVQDISTTIGACFSDAISNGSGFKSK